MINQRLAFNKYTTISILYEEYVEGVYDENNIWTGDSWLPPISIKATPLPYGDRESGVTGQMLKALDVGERYPGFIRVWSTKDMLMKSYLTIYSIRYQVIQYGDFSGAGFYSVIATKELEK